MGCRTGLLERSERIKREDDERQLLLRYIDSHTHQDYRYPDVIRVPSRVDVVLISTRLSCLAVGEASTHVTVVDHHTDLVVIVILIVVHATAKAKKHHRMYRKCIPVIPHMYKNNFQAQSLPLSPKIGDIRLTS